MQLCSKFPWSMGVLNHNDIIEYNQMMSSSLLAFNNFWLLNYLYITYFYFEEQQ